MRTRTLTPTEKKWVNTIATDPTLWKLCLASWVDKMGADAGNYMEDFLRQGDVESPSYVELRGLSDRYRDLVKEMDNILDTVPKDIQRWMKGLSVQGQIVVEETLRGLKDGGVM